MPNNNSKASPSKPVTTVATAYSHHSPLMAAFDHFANIVTRWAGSPMGFALAFISILIWSILGPAFHYSEEWQLVVNTGTTIVTFLMVFLLQQSQNKDSVAIHLKLNELLASNKAASNRMIGIEELDEETLREVANFYVRLAENAKSARNTKAAHSIDEEGMPTDARAPKTKTYSTKEQTNTPFRRPRNKRQTPER